MKLAFHVVIAFFIVVMGFLLLFQQNVLRISSPQHKPNTVAVFFKNAVLDSEIESYKKEIKEKYVNSSVFLISKKDSLNDFKAKFEKIFDDTVSDELLIDLVPATLQISFSTKEEKQNYLLTPILNEQVEEAIDLDKPFLNLIKLSLVTSTYSGIIFATVFVLSSLLTSLLIKHLIISEEKIILIKSLYGTSYKEIFNDYFSSMTQHYLLTLGAGFSFLFGFYMLFKRSLIQNIETQFIAEKIQFLNVTDLFILTGCFALAYFASLYFVLNQSLQQTFLKND